MYALLVWLSLAGASGLAEESATSMPAGDSSPVDAECESLDGDWWRPAALDGPLETDRPDFTESTSTVPRGHLQLESGYTFTCDREGDVTTKSHTAPELLLRVGIVDDLELRVGWAGYTWMNQRMPGRSRADRPIMLDDWTQGGADQYLGFKWQLFKQHGLRPEFAIIPAVTVPTGGGGFSSGDVDPEIKLAWAYDLTERFAVAGNVNLATPTGDRGRFFQVGNSISFSAALLDDVAAYFEYFGFYPNERGSDCAHSLNTGLTWQLTPNFQLDWRIGHGLNEEADDFFTGVGFSIRY